MTPAPFDIQPLGATAYLAPDGFAGELAAELGGASPALGEALFIQPGPARPAAWAQNIWPDLVEIRFGSIGAAAKGLRSLARNWAHYPLLHHRRASLIAEKLPHVSAKPLLFPAAAPTAPLGAWTLLEPDRLIASARAASPFANGEALFVENREGPPSRAYLKLWEALALARRWPGPGQHCLDLGAAPGGWTWVLATLGAEVTAVDKAALDPKILTMPGVTHRQESAFGIDPANEPPYDWVVSDIVCYPERLVRLVLSWLEAQPQASYIVTVKFQGATDMAPLEALRAIHGSTLLHLSHNKHELTWMRVS